jgi:hypothetical protein
MSAEEIGHRFARLTMQVIDDPQSVDHTGACRDGVRRFYDGRPLGATKADRSRLSQ